MDQDASHHICKVLRQSIGSHFRVFNGTGTDYEATLVKTGKTAVVELGAALTCDTESPLQTHLIQAISRSDRMDSCIQKSVELGVNTISPLFTERGSVKLNTERASRKTEHWRKISISACEQCGRSVIPTINEPIKMSSLSSLDFNDSLKLVLAPTAQRSLTEIYREDLINQHRHITLLIGAESGFTDNELANVEKIGFIPIKFGPRILRTETAAPATLSVLQYLWGDL